MASNSKLMDFVEYIVGNSRSLQQERCGSYLLFRGETALGNGLRAFLYLLGLAYCFFGLSAITAHFFRSMENVVKQKKKVTVIDPYTNIESTKHERVWNYAIADITLLAFGTSFPQISLATIDAFRNLGQLYAGGLGPGTLVGSAAFDLFPIHAVCVVVPKAGTLKKISDIGVWLVELFWSFWAYIWLYIILEVWTPNVITLWEALLTVLQFGFLLLHAYAQDKRLPYFSIPMERSERPDDWVPEEPIVKSDNDGSDMYAEILPADEGREVGVKKDGQYLLKDWKTFLATNSCPMAVFIRFHPPLSHCSWMDCFHMLIDIHKRNSIHCYKVYRSYKLCHRDKCLCHSIHSLSSWDLMARFGCKQDCCRASNNCRFCHCKYHVQQLGEYLRGHWHPMVD